MSGYRTVARLEDIPETGLRGVDVDGVKIALARTAHGEVFALLDECSHEEYPLSDGELTGDQVTCMLHGARFELASGRARALPAVRPVKTFECRVEGDEIQVRLD